MSSLPLAKDTSEERSKTSTVGGSVKLIIVLFLMSIITPIIIQAGPLRLSPYRLVLILAFPFLVLNYLQGRCGHKSTADTFLLLHCSWVILASIRNHGIHGIENSGIYMMETFGSYLLARYYIRDKDSFLFFIKASTTLVIAFLPFVLYEARTGNSVFLQLLDIAFSVPPDIDKEPRLGLQRAQGPFEHPILFGIFCASIFIFAYSNIPDGKRLVSKFRSALVTIAVFLSLSVGAYVIILIQLSLTTYNQLLSKVRSRWLLLAVGIGFCYLAVDLISNRTPIAVLYSYLSFDQRSAYYRILLFDFASIEVLQNPIFGIGFNEWSRPYWMSGSIDNFWIVIALRYGIPSFLLFLAFITVTLRTMMKASIDRDNQEVRNAFVFAIVSICLAITTVHLWNATYVFVMFLVGSGMWLSDQQSPPLVGSTRR